MNGNTLAKGSMVSEILKGRKPGDIPTEVPKAGRLVVNTKRSHGLGIAMTTEFLETAKKDDTM